MKSNRKKTPVNRPHAYHRTDAPRNPRSTFITNPSLTTTFDAGYLVPIFCEEVLPGDTWSVKAGMLARLTTPIYPLMDNIYLDTHFFFVPRRLVWDNWERFCGARDNPTDTIDFLVPQMPAPAGGWTVRSLADYFGIPILVDNLNVDACYFRAYNLIFNEWFRHQDLQDSVVVDTDDGPDLSTDYTLLRRNKRHDYFTSALPWTQKGDPVQLPLGTSAPVLTDGTTPTLTGPGFTNTNFTHTSGPTGYLRASTSASAIGNVQFGDNTGLYAELSGATSATVNDIRLAVLTQQFLELSARAGTRYPEMLMAYWGQSNGDARLQRPEYLGGGSQIMDIYQQPNTAGTSGGLGASLGAFAQGFGSHGFTRSFTEYGMIIGLVSARTDLGYQQGLRRMWSRRDFYDFALPIFSGLGEQPIYNRELYAQGTTADDDVFGYVPRYDEYRSIPKMITGDMRSTAPTPLDAWHLALDFASLPVLSDAWMQEDPPIDRVVTFPSEAHFRADLSYNISMTRVLPVRGIPGIDHF